MKARSMEPLDYDYVVIGSGFGGSVSALRLSEKGYRVAVLEMGKRYRAEDFARTNWDLRRYLWRPSLGCHGIFQTTFLRDALVFHGAGVGGGSLVYANTLIEPPDKAFRDPRWPGDDDWKAKLAPHYRMARFMLGAAESPRTFVADELLREAVEEETGRPSALLCHPVGVYFGVPRETVPDPYFGGEGPDRTGCVFCGECQTGCRRGAKNTLDRNYLYLAERRGCVVYPETRAVDVRPLDGGGYAVHSVRSTSRWRKERRVFRATGVVFSAGPLGTVKLLLECRRRGALPRLSTQVGSYVRTNGEAILAASARGSPIDYSEGIAISSGVFVDDDTHVEIVRYGRGQNSSALLMTHLTAGGPPWPRWLRWLGNLVRHPIAFARAHDPVDWAARTSIVLFMQSVSSHMHLDVRWRPWGRALVSRVTAGEPPPIYFPVANRLTARLARKMKGTAGSNIVEVLGNVSTTAHILGGAIMGRTPAQGVCDSRGKVFGYNDMYVADGSLVPANLGVNPSLTITALAEYVMSCIADHPHRARKPAPRPPASPPLRGGLP